MTTATSVPTSESAEPSDSSALDARTRANLANAQKSTGPRTPEGKARVATNATKHGLTGHRLHLEAEDFLDYYSQGAAYIADLQPVGMTEIQLVQKIIDANWRVNLCAALMTNTVTTLTQLHAEYLPESDSRWLSVSAQTSALIDDCARSNSLDKLSRIEGRLTRQLLQFQREFDRVQEARFRRQNPEDVYVLEQCPAYNQYLRQYHLAAERETARAQAAAAQAAEAEAQAEAQAKAEAAAQAAAPAATAPAESATPTNEATSSLGLFCQTTPETPAPAHAATAAAAQNFQLAPQI